MSGELASAHKRQDKAKTRGAEKLSASRTTPAPPRNIRVVTPVPNKIKQFAGLRQSR